MFLIGCSHIHRNTCYLGTQETNCIFAEGNSQCFYDTSIEKCFCDQWAVCNEIDWWWEKANE